MVLKKVTYDQLLFAPVFLMVLLSAIGIFKETNQRTYKKNCEKNIPKFC